MSKYFMIIIYVKILQFIVILFFYIQQLKNLLKSFNFLEPSQMTIRLPKFTIQDNSEEIVIKAGSKLYPKGISASAFKRAWTDGWDGRGIKVAVIDTGVDSSHPDLSGKIIKQMNFTSEPGITQPHATHVAGTICASGSKWLVGGAPGCSILSYKVITASGGTIQDIIKAINQAVNDGATVINMSLGAEGLAQSDINSLTTCITSAFSKGVVSIVASGNEGTSICTTDPYSWPASVQSAESIAAVDIGNDLETITLAPFSNENDRVSAAGCGVNVISTVLGGKYGIFSGTSMATPHVSALAAVLSQKIKQESPKLNGIAFSNALISEINQNIKYIPPPCSNISVFGKNILTPSNCGQVISPKALSIHPQTQSNISFGKGFVRYQPANGCVKPGGKQYYYSNIFLGHQV
jgi:major intracellular serine protease